jgi:hypothetical protein
MNGNDRHVILTGCTFSGNTANYDSSRGMILQGGYHEFHDLLLDSTEGNQSIYISQYAPYYSTVLIDGMTCSPGSNTFTAGSDDTAYEVTIRIQAGSLNMVSASHANARKFVGSTCSVVSVGAYDADGTWIVGGTASFVTNSGSTVSLSGIGTYVNANGDSDLSFTKSNWEPIMLRAAIVTERELTFTGTSVLAFHSTMPADAIVANPITIADGAALTIVNVSGNTVTISGPASGSTISNAGVLS